MLWAGETACAVQAVITLPPGQNELFGHWTQGPPFGP